MPAEPLRILIVGAHPDDADIKAGGSAALWADGGHVVRLVSMTDGGAGHHVVSGPPLADRRRAEAGAAAAVIGATYDVLDIPDGTLDVRLDYRHRLIRMIREFRPDVLMTHRPNDYHPDHRSTSTLVQDASYMLTVPAVCPDVPFLPAPPLILYFSDAFRKPRPFEPDVAVAIDPVIDRVVSMLDCHASQFYEWLPFNAGEPDAVPATAEGRRAWLGGRFRERVRPLADRYRGLVNGIYGDELGRRVEFVEAFEVSEYGAPLDAGAWRRVFPFLPEGSAGCAPMAGRRWVDQPEAVQRVAEGRTKPGAGA